MAIRKKRKSVFLWLVVSQLILYAVLCGTIDAEASTEFSGEGTVEKPYLIYSADDLLLLSELVNEEEREFRDQYFALANDIDMSGIEFTPIGKCGSGHYFWGCFDGNGYAIKNISIDIPDSNNGFFGELGGIVVNLIIDGGEINGNCCGTISSHAASSQARIMNCQIKNVIINAGRAGGVVDNFSGSVVNCLSVDCVLNGEVTYGAITSCMIGCDSHGNHYSAPSNSNPSATEIIFGGSQLIVFGKTDLDIITDTLNTNYRYYDKYSIPYLGICNIWSRIEGRIELSKTKQAELFMSNLSKLSGNGTITDPYLINNADDLCIFRDAVNSGYDFLGKYVRQNANIDLSEEIWTPIGQQGTGKYFCGIYDGNGHTIANITTISEGDNGFFGILDIGGTVANLGIENGLIRGTCCGGIVSGSISKYTMVVNCYNKADVFAVRAGGITDNFMGSIIGCWSDCILNGYAYGGISSYSVQNISWCKTSFRTLAPEDTMSGTIIDSEKRQRLSGIGIAQCIEEHNDKISKIKELSDVKVNLYMFSSEEGQLRFSDKQYTYGLKEWINDHTSLFVFLIILAIIVLCLIFKIGPQRFYTDDRRWWKRFVLILAPTFLFFYIFLVHSPIEFFIVNNSEFEFVFCDFAYKYIVLAILCSVVISMLIALSKSKLCDILACAIFGLDLDMYFQLNFLNGSLGLLDGTEKNVNITGNIINFILWIVIFTMPFVLFFVFKRYRSKVIMFVCGTLCFMQITSLVILIAQSPNSVFDRKSSHYYLSANDQFTISADKNIIIFAIDAYSNSYLDELFEAYPEVKGIIKDFTYYSNADCHYEGSVYSINYLASGTEWDPTISINKWCQTAWNNEKNDRFYSRLKEQGYIFNLYSTQLSGLSNDAQINAMGKVANLVEDECDFLLNNEMMFNLFMNASLYRVMPNIYKDKFEFTASKYQSAYIVISKDNKAIDYNMKLSNADFYKELKSKGLKTDDTKNYYILLHLDGVHGPYSVNENCESVSESTLLETERGCWRYIEEYINQLKELGVYDNTTIIITADHGKHHDYYDAQPIFFIKNANEEHDTFIETNAPISFSDIMPTVIYLAGGEYSDLGTTIFEHYENEMRERTLYIRMYDDELPDVPKRDSPTKSTLNCFYKYVYTGNIDDLREIGDKGPTEKISWTDSFY